MPFDYSILTLIFLLLKIILEDKSFYRVITMTQVYKELEKSCLLYCKNLVTNQFI
jgi:hypothetical protein